MCLPAVRLAAGKTSRVSYESVCERLFSVWLYILPIQR